MLKSQNDCNYHCHSPFPGKEKLCRKSASMIFQEWLATVDPKVIELEYKQRFFGRGLTGLCYFAEWMDYAFYNFGLYADELPSVQNQPVFYGFKHDSYVDNLPFAYNWYYFNANMVTQFILVAMRELQEYNYVYEIFDMSWACMVSF